MICGKRQAAISGIVHAEIHKDGTTLILRAVYPRLDGAAILLNALKSGPWLEGDVEAVEIDFGDVEYLNSLGITELVTIHRLVQEQTRGKTRFRFFKCGPQDSDDSSLWKFKRLLKSFRDLKFSLFPLIIAVVGAPEISRELPDLAKRTDFVRV